MIYKCLVRPLFFTLNPEAAHAFVVWAVKALCWVPGARYSLSKFFTISHPKLTRKLFGLNFSNPVGLAAGFDKNADFFNELSAFGFSFIEIGTVTPLSQPGNPKPRLFRLIPDKALVNRMGFNNKGVDYVKLKLTKRKNSNLIIGGNIGKNTATPNELAVNDYLIAFRALYPLVDYLVINVSCPNIKDLRELQNEDSLGEILAAVMDERKKFGSHKPILLKVSPDLTDEQLISTIHIAEKHGIDGYIATNTSTSRENLRTPRDKVEAIGNGGLSGKPIAERSTEVIKLIHSQTRGAKPIIGVGGIFTPEDAIEKLRAGASLVQVYTGFIYEGPAIAKRINMSLINNDLS